ncbi:MAG: hypothetical protein ACOY4Q_09290 [Bacillota bacterium]
MQTMQDKTIKELAKECKTVEDVHQMLRDLFKDTVNAKIKCTKNANEKCATKISQ